ncbi:MAG: hypothetical protein ACYC27_00875 [Armatimonadota bacterium]
MYVDKYEIQIDNTYIKTKDYLEDNEIIYNKIISHMKAFNSIESLIPDTISIDVNDSCKSYPFALSHMELITSLELCRRGFYLQAIYSLRNTLELSILGLYFDSYSKIKAIEWFISNVDTPFFSNDVLPNLFDTEYYIKYLDKDLLKNKIKELYKCMSDYCHCKGKYYSSIHLNSGNINNFNERSLLKYTKLMLDTVENIIIMILIRYPIGMQCLPLRERFGCDIPMGYLDATDQGAVFNVLDNEILKKLYKISNSDENVRYHCESVFGIEVDDQINSIINYPILLKSSGKKA